MASFGKRLTRFVAAQTIRAVQIRILRVLGKGLCSAHDISDQALWPKLQGKLNREWRIYRMDLPFWQSGSLSLLGVPLILRLISAAFRCDVDLTRAPHRRISAKVWGSSVDAAHDPALFAGGGERTGAAGSRGRAAGGLSAGDPSAGDPRASGDRGPDRPACQDPRLAGGAGAVRHPAGKQFQSARRLSRQFRFDADQAWHRAGAWLSRRATWPTACHIWPERIGPLMATRRARWCFIRAAITMCTETGLPVEDAVRRRFSRPVAVR
jgi:hypothetical protein